MAQYKWHATKHKGLRYREHESRKHGIKKDRFYQYRLMEDGERVQESFGWLSEGWTEESCMMELASLKQNRRTGSGPITLKEKRSIKGAERSEAERINMTFKTLWEKYLQQAIADRGESALRREKSLYKYWIEPELGKRAVKDVAPIHLEKIKSNMTKAGNSPRSVQYCLSVIRQVFNYGMRHSLFTGDNPVGKVKAPKFDNKRVRFLSYDEADRLMAELKQVSFETYSHAMVALHCGLRASEIFNLTWGDVNLESGIMTLRDTKSGKTRAAFATEALLNLLRERKPVSAAHNDLVFPGRGGVKIQAKSAAFQRAVERLGLNMGVSDDRQKVVFHTLRHTFASWMVQAGVDLYRVKELMGHSDFKMTSRYAHLAPDSLQAAVKTFEASMNGNDTGAEIIPIQKQAAA